MQVITKTIQFEFLNFKDDIKPTIALQGQTGDDYFPRTSPDTGTGIEIDSDIDVVEFIDKPSQVFAFLAGFRVGFTDVGDGRPFGNLVIRVHKPEALSDKKYRVPVTLGLRDWTGDWDDRHGGEVDIVVIGD